MEYHRPASIDEALRIMARAGAEGGGSAAYVAGGTDLAVQIAESGSRPGALVDLTGIARLRGVEGRAGGVRIGAAVTIEELAGCPDLPACLRQGARSIGSPQIRALATIGGNICNASPCGDTLAGLIVLDARFVLVSPRGEREIAAERFFRGPKLTVREPGEILQDILIPAEALEGGSAFRMIGKRNGQVISQVNLAVWLCREGRPDGKAGTGAVAAVRLAAGSVAPVPLRLPLAEGVLRGKVPSPELLRRAELEAAREIRPISDVRSTASYRRAVLRGLLREALEEALVQALDPDDRPRPGKGGPG